LKAKTDRNEFQRINGILSGLDGLVYLAFLGRETYTTRIQGSLVPAIYKNAPSVYQTVNRLLKHGSEFLIFKREERGKGKGGKERKIYIANFSPIFLTLQAHNINFDEKELRNTIDSLSAANDLFPRFLLNLFDRSIVVKSSWHLTLSNYFTFLSNILRFSNQEELHSFMLPDIPIDRENIEALTREYPELTKQLDLMAMRITLPGLRLNPQFESYVVKGVEGLGMVMSDSQELIKFFHELRRMGITNLENYHTELLNGAKEAQKLLARLEEAQEFLAKLEKIKSKLKEAVKREDYEEVEKLINHLQL